MLNKGDVLDAGAGTADNLNVDFTGILGGIAVDLTSTTDQIGTMDGATNSVAQVGFESVDLSGYTGFGASITGTKSANILTGTGSIDSISGGAGSDTITGGAGADVINVGTGSNDIVSVASATDSTTAAVVLGTTDISATVDVITGMGDTDRVTFTTASITTASAVALDTAVQVTTGSATADDIGLIRGTYASVTGIFTAGTATSDDDYLVSYLESNASGSDAISHVVLMDIVGTVTSDTLANGIELNV